MTSERITPEDRLRQAISRLRNLTIQSGTYKAWLGGDFQTVQFIDSESLTLGKDRQMTVDIWAGSEQIESGDWQDSAAVALVMALHRTIQPQIELLVYALAELALSKPEVPLPRVVVHALDIADGILGAK